MANLAEGRLRLDRLCHNGSAATFFPLAFGQFLAKQESCLRTVLRCASVASDVASVASGQSIAIETAWCGLKNEERDFKMATIGTFKTNGTNEFIGEIVTLSLMAKNVRIARDTRCTSENAPSHRVKLGRVDLGAGWTKRSEKERDYLSIKLDDPSFKAPIYAALVQDESDESGDTYSLVWSRPDGNKQSGN